MTARLCIAVLCLTVGIPTFAQTFCSSMTVVGPIGVTGVDCNLTGYGSTFSQDKGWVNRYDSSSTFGGPSTTEWFNGYKNGGIGVCGLSGTILRYPDFDAWTNIRTDLSSHVWNAKSQNYRAVNLSNYPLPPAYIAVPSNVTYAFPIYRELKACQSGGGCSQYCGFECMDDYPCPVGQQPYCSGGRIGTITCRVTPIIIDPLGQGFHLTSAAGGVEFRMMANQPALRLAWTDPNYVNGWLALDRNADGVIGDSTELFGNNTPQPPGGEQNGFNALALFDQRQSGGNANGKIDPGDAVFSRLRLWVDSNHDGKSHPMELVPLIPAGIFGIDLAYFSDEFTDENGNAFRYQSRIWNRVMRSSPWAYDVYLQVDE